eukprot:1352465-Rhodomonas_salina.2
MSSTEMRHAATSPVLSCAMLPAEAKARRVAGLEGELAGAGYCPLSTATTRLLPNVLRVLLLAGCCLVSCGTFGAEKEYGGTREGERGARGAGARGRAWYHSPMLLRLGYALSGTDVGYAATREGDGAKEGRRG